MPPAKSFSILTEPAIQPEALIAEQILICKQRFLWKPGQQQASDSPHMQLLHTRLA